MSEHAMLCRMYLKLEYECHLLGKNVEVPTSAIIEILKATERNPNENLRTD